MFRKDIVLANAYLYFLLYLRCRKMFSEILDNDANQQKMYLYVSITLENNLHQFTHMKIIQLMFIFIVYAQVMSK